MVTQREELLFLSMSENSYYFPQEHLSGAFWLTRKEQSPTKIERYLRQFHAIVIITLFYFFFKYFAQ